MSGPAVDWGDLISVLEWIPAPHPENGVLGHARLLINGSLILSDCRVLRMRDGRPRCVFPKRCDTKIGQPAKWPSGEWKIIEPVAFAEGGYSPFSRACIQAIRTQHPGSIPYVAGEPPAAGAVRDAEGHHDTPQTPEATSDQNSDHAVDVAASLPAWARPSTVAGRPPASLPTGD